MRYLPSHYCYYCSCITKKSPVYGVCPCYGVGLCFDVSPCYGFCTCYGVSTFRGPKTPSASALLTRRFLHVRQIFALVTYNVSLKSLEKSHQRRWMVSSSSYNFPNNMKSSSGQFKLSLESSSTLRRISILSLLSRRFQ